MNKAQIIKYLKTSLEVSGRRDPDGTNHKYSGEKLGLRISSIIEVLELEMEPVDTLIHNSNNDDDGDFLTKYHKDKTT